VEETKTGNHQHFLDDKLGISEQYEVTGATTGSEYTKTEEETKDVDDDEDDGQVSEDRQETLPELPEANSEYEKEMRELENMRENYAKKLRYLRRHKQDDSF